MTAYYLDKNGGLLQTGGSFVERWPRNLRIGEMDVLQIRAKLTYLGRAERFCDGVIADAVDDGTMLRLLERLKLLAEKE